MDEFTGFLLIAAALFAFTVILAVYEFLVADDNGGIGKPEEAYRDHSVQTTRSLVSDKKRDKVLSEEELLALNLIVFDDDHK